MYCLKCGRDTVANKIFCQDCLTGMERYPVKPGTAIQLPQRTTKVIPKKPAKRTPTPEEQIASLKKSRFWLTAAVVLLSAALCLALLFPRPTAVSPEAAAPAATEATAAPGTEEPTKPVIPHIIITPDPTADPSN